MEYVGHGDLSEYLRRHKKMPEYVAQEVLRQSLEAVHYVHEQGVTHRDIKPDNILLVSEHPMVVKISDFGLAKMVTEETFLHTFCGTMHFLAPEIFPSFWSQAANEEQKVELGSKRKRQRTPT